MKINIFLLLVLLFSCLISCDKQKELSPKTFILQGIIDGESLKDSVSIELFYITYENGDWLRNVESAEVIDGKFTFKGNIKEQTSAILYLKDTPISLYLEPIEMKIHINMDKPYAYKLTGTKGERENVVLQKFMEPIEEATYIKLCYILENINKVNKETHPLSIDSLSKIINASIEEYSIIKEKKDSLLLEFVSENNTFQIIPSLLFNLSDNKIINIDTIRYLYNGMPLQVRNSFMGKLANEKIKRVENQELFLNSGLIPNFKRESFSGEHVELHNLKGNKYILLDFWASWCGPCIKEIPKMKGLYNKYKDKGLEIIGISLDDDTITWSKAIRKYELDLWTQILSKQANSDKHLFTDPLSELFNVGNGIPYYILVNKEGEIIARWEWIGDEQLDILDNVLKK